MLPDPVWRVLYDVAIPPTVDVAAKRRMIRRGQLVLEGAVIAALPSRCSEIAGWRYDDTIQLIDDGPEWLWRRG